MFSVHTGRSIAELRSEISPLITNAFSDALPYTSDENLILFAKYFTKVAAAYNKESPSASYFYMNPEKATTNILFDMKNKYKDLMADEQKMESQIIKNYSGKNIKIPNEQDISTSLGLVIEALKNRRIDLNMYPDANVTPDKYYSYCVGLISMYEETLKLPKKEAAALIRYFVATK